MDFAGHLRDPEGRPAPVDVENRRMQIYRDLFFNNIKSLLGNNFPVLRQMYDKAQWAGLVRDFYARHQSRTPLFPELPKEFLRYLQDERGAHDEDPAFLHELAHYEWVELALSMDEREPYDCDCDPQGDLLNSVPVLSPLAWPLTYRFPVHLLKPDFRPETPPAEPTHLLVYRNRDDDVKFMKLNGFSHELLVLLKENQGRTGRQLLEELVSLSGHPNPDAVFAGGASLLNDLRERDAILGTRRVK